MTRRHSTSGPSQRMLRVGELVRHALARLFERGEILDPLLEGVTITVPEVRMSPDLKLATAYIMPLGGEKAEAIARALNSHSRFIRGRIAPMIDLKYAPDMRFFVDTTFAEADRIDNLLRSEKVRRDVETAPEDDE